MSENKDTEKKEFIKIILLGNSGVGKTSIINRFYIDLFSEVSECTIAMNFVEKKIKINDKIINLNIWDTAGQEQFRSVNKLFIKNAQIVIFVYDITNLTSFKELEYWHTFIYNELGQSPFLAIMGNKKDLYEKEKVNEDEARELSKEWNAYFSLVSAKDVNDKKNIDNQFQYIIKQYLRTRNNNHLRNQSIVLDKRTLIETPEKRNNCCEGGKLMKKEKAIKIIFLGGKGVGKTHIIQAIKGKIINKKYEHTKSFTKIRYKYDFENKTKYKVSIIDTGEDCLKSNEFKYILKSCRIFFLIFNTSKKDSFDELDKWVKEIKFDSGDKKVFINILGNKEKASEEAEDNITYEEAENYAKQIGGNFDIVSIDDISPVQNIININIENYLNNL